MTEDWRAGGFGLYIHWPFCEAKCPYCDFNSHVRANIDQTRWLSAYFRELDHYAELVPGRVLNSIFLGGGTPSLMDPDIVAALLDRVRQIWAPANDLEITLEANPSSVEARRFAGFAEAGVNRVSLGVQALNDEDLRRLGRLHNVADAISAFETARSYFDRVSFDLIYARQNQSLSDWRVELIRALEMAIDHVSLYQLTIEPGTVFSRRLMQGGLCGLPSDDLSADMYELTQEVCQEAGFNAYEVSNHAKPGAESRHNLIYWKYGDYIGIGPGAHGRITLQGTRFETETWSSPEKYLSVQKTGNTLKRNEIITRWDQAKELLLMGLRVADGVDLCRYEALAEAPLSISKARELESLDLVRLGNGRIAATPKGRLVLNSVIAELLED